MLPNIAIMVARSEAELRERENRQYGLEVELHDFEVNASFDAQSSAQKANRGANQNGFAVKAEGLIRDISQLGSWMSRALRNG